MVQQQDEQQSTFSAWFREMGRRHVFRVLAIYVAVGWGFTEIVQGVVGQVGGPDAISTFVTIVKFFFIVTSGCHDSDFLVDAANIDPTQQVKTVRLCTLD